MQVTFKINGKTVKAERRENLLKVARREGFDIPGLCYHEALSPYGACRLCLVEVVEPSGRRRITTSCTYPVEEGIEVFTDSERVLRDRRMVLELLLTRAPDAPVLRELAEEMGIERPRFEPVEDGRGCILCGLCVRVCSEVIGANAIGFAGRGTRREVTTPFHIQADACIGCGACAEVCPTGVIKVEDTPDGKRILSYWNTTIALTKCELCGRYFTPEPGMERTKARLEEALGVELPEDVLGICPECRRKEFGRKMIIVEPSDLREEV